MPEDKKSSTVDFLNNIDGPFVEEPIEKEKEATEVEVEEDSKPLPFHKDPKLQRYIEKQVEKGLKDQPRGEVEQQFRKDVEVNLPQSFVKLVGNDTEEKKQVLKDLSDYFGNLKGDAKKEAWEEMQQQSERAQEQQVEADNQAVEELENYFDEIEDTFNVDLSSNSTLAKKTRAEFIDYVRKIAPKNEDGEVSAFPDLVSSFEEFQDKNKRAPATRAKELASRGLTRSNDTTTALPQGRSWKDVDRFFNKLKAN